MNSQRILSPQQTNTVCNDCIVKDHSALKNCPAECLKFFSEAKRVIAYLKGQRIVMEGTVSPYIYCVRSGKVKILISDSVGNEMIIRFAKSGDIVGFEDIEMNKDHRLSAVALEDTVMCYLEQDTFLQLAHHYNDLAMGLLKYYKEEYQNAILNSTRLAHLNVAGKIAYALLIIHKTFGIDENDHSLNLLISRKEIADLAYTTKEQVSKIFTQLREQGIIDTIGNTKIVIRNVEALKTLSQA